MIGPRASIQAVITVARTFGARGAALRAAHEFRRRFGWFRLEPYFIPSTFPESTSPFLVNRLILSEAVDQDQAVARANRVASGEHQAYRWEWRSLPQDVSGWRQNLVTGYEYSDEIPWWRIAHLISAAGDIKDVWEPARFGWVFDLVRAYLVTGDDRYVEVFTKYFTSWHKASPPFKGVHWSCGQESAIRAIALLYADANFRDSKAYQREVRRRVVETLCASGERIADAIGYAISQRNNHGISEAAALVALGVSLSGVHPEADKWLSTGAGWISRLIMEQFALDGWYVQHSFTYLRLALDQCIVAQRALQSVGRRLPEHCVARLRAATNLLIAVADTESGIVPNHGANDGAFVHPITSADYRDFRPVITAAAVLFGCAMPSGLPQDQEVLAWLGKEPPEVSVALVNQVISGSSGWAAIRVGPAFAFVRAGSYSSRPSHLDPLHLDVRIDSQEIVVDPGTFAYQAAEPWRNGLATARVHNGPLLDDQEPGVRGPRFLWYAWPEARIISADFTAGTATVIAEIPGRVKRRVEVRNDAVTIEDRPVAQSGAKQLTVRWLRHPAAPGHAILSDPPGQAIPAREDDPRGWFSPYYRQRIPSEVIEINAPVVEGARVITRIAIPRSATGGSNAHTTKSSPATSPIE